VPGLRWLGERGSLLHLVRSEEVDEVVMALPAEAHVEALRLSAALQDAGVGVRILPDVFEMVAMKARVEDFYGLPLISITEPSINPVQARIKRAFDLVLASLAFALCLPVMAVIALLVRLDSPGPIFVHQRRVGAGGRPFAMHKFRSMIWNPEDLDRAHTKRPDDPRVTRVGRVLRRTSLDELPQLWNVLMGEMSLVGPRPELPAIVETYEPWQLKRFVVPPGMTGWWQVNGRSEAAMQHNTEIDLYYVQNYSILLDLQILARTLGAVIRGKGAY
jgi:exopolysaccharide biosynthesis polyprenyl glycosylphosphotransferase